MFGKVIVFGLFEMIKKKESGPRPRVRVRPLSLVRRRGPPQLYPIGLSQACCTTFIILLDQFYT